MRAASLTALGTVPGRREAAEHCWLTLTRCGAAAAGKRRAPPRPRMPSSNRCRRSCARKPSFDARLARALRLELRAHGARWACRCCKLDDAPERAARPAARHGAEPRRAAARARRHQAREHPASRRDRAPASTPPRRDPGHYYTAHVRQARARRGLGAGDSRGITCRSTSRSCRASAPLVGPVFMGANPARVRSGPQAGFRLLAAEEDLGRELITHAAGGATRSAAVIRDTAFAEILTGNDREVRTRARRFARQPR